MVVLLERFIAATNNALPFDTQQHVYSASVNYSWNRGHNTDRRFNSNIF